MASHSSGAPPGGASRSQEPPPPEHTPEQLLMIHAAMMEELGVGRKDALHLADRGPDVSEMKPLPAKRKLQSATARWRNIEFDDLDPADEALDAIADGQLYRLRRGLSSAPTERGGSHVAPRGARAGPRAQAGRPDHVAHPGTHQRSTSLSEHHDPTARQPPRGANRASYAKHVGKTEDALARLRNPPAPVTTSRASRESGNRGSRGNHRGGPTALQIKAESPKPQDPVPARPKFVLDRSTNDAFFAHFNVNPQRQAPVPDAQPWPVREASTMPPPRKSAQSPPQPAPVTTGLSGSRWADPARQTGSISHTATPVRWADIGISDPVIVDPKKPDRGSAAPALPVVNNTSAHHGSEGLSAPATATPVIAARSSTIDIEPTPAQGLLAHSGRTVLAEKRVLYQRDNGSSRFAMARLTKSPDDTNLTIELTDTNTDGVILHELVSDDSSVEFEATSIVYRAASSASTASPTWKLSFQMPYLANVFWNAIQTNRQSRPASDPLAPASTAVALSSSDLDYLAQAGAAASVDSAAHSAPMFTTPSQSVDGYPDAPATQVPVLFSRASTEQEDAVRLGYGPASQDVDGQVAREDTEQLISFAEEVLHEPEISQGIKELLEIEDAEVIESIFNYLEENAPGSALTKLSQIALGSSDLRANTLTAEEVLNSKDYLWAAKLVVTHTFSDSDTFLRLQKSIRESYLEDKSRKLLSLAISRCYPGRGSGATAATDDAVVEGTKDVPIPNLLPEENIKAEPTDPTDTRAYDATHTEDMSIELNSVFHEPIENPRTEDFKGVSAEAVTSSAALSHLSNQVSAGPPRPPVLDTTEHKDTVKYSPQILTKVRDSAAPVWLAGEPLLRGQPSIVTGTVDPPVTTTSGWDLSAVVESKNNVAGGPTPVSKTAIKTDPVTDDSSISARPSAASTPGPIQQTAEDAKDPVKVPVTSAPTPVPGLKNTQLHPGPTLSETTDSNHWNVNINQFTEARSTGLGLATTESAEGAAKPSPTVSDIDARLAESLQGLNLETKNEAIATQAVHAVPSQYGRSVSVTSESTAAGAEETLPALRKISSNASSTVSQAMTERCQAALKLSMTPKNPAAKFSRPKSSLAHAIELVPKFEPAELGVSFTAPTNCLSEPSVLSKVVETRPDVDSEHEPTGSTEAGISFPTNPTAVPEAGVVPEKVLIPEEVTVPEAGKSAPMIENKSESTPGPVVMKKDPVNEISNFSLKGALGLSGSRWASPSAGSVINSSPRRHAPLAVVQNAPQALSQTPPQAHVPGPWASSPRVVAPIQAPALATVLVQDARGNYLPVTGMSMVGIAQPVNPFPMARHQMHPGHAPYRSPAMTPPTAADIPARSDTYSRHISNGPSATDQSLHATSPAHAPLASTQRAPLSPRKVRAQVQDRLKNSMAGSRNSYPGAPQ